MVSSKSVDASLWWDPFSDILTEIENSTILHPSLLKKLNDNRAWFVKTVSLFKPANERSKDALSSPKVMIGDHELNIRPELKEKALRASSFLGLDEVQSYILVERSLEGAIDSVVQESLHVILPYYYVERQCLLKCTRQILMHNVYAGKNFQGVTAVKEEALKLISDGLEGNMICVLENLISSNHPEEMDVDLFTLWAEETLIEDNLVLEILFLVYYWSFCTCTGEKWIKLCTIYKEVSVGSYNFERLAVSAEALQSTSDAKVKLLFILIESLDMENLLKIVHDELPFREGDFIFSMIDIQHIDEIISSLSASEAREAGPLMLAWAVFICLLTSLPGNEKSEIMDIDHIGYVRQAFEAASLGRFVEILQSDLLTESDGAAAGYRSVLRTFLSAFIASYEINLQFGDPTLNVILDIICKIYRGEESLCAQFWDRASFIDSPIRCLLCNLEGEFPLRSLELVRLLSALCEGCWPAECVFNFLENSVGISSLFEITPEALIDDNGPIVQTLVPLHVPGVEGLLIPSKTRGHVLKVVDENTAIVRWEYTQSGVLVLLLRLSQELYHDSNEEALLIFDLINRMVSFNTAVCFSLIDIGNSWHHPASRLGGQFEDSFWVVEVICTVIRNLSLNQSGAAVMSLGVSILTKLLECFPSRICAIALKANIFDVAAPQGIIDASYSGSSSGSWMVSGKLAKMLIIDSEENDYDMPLAISVLDFTMQLLERGFENDFLLTLIVLALQFILVNHEYWKYKVKHFRWKVTLKAFEVMKSSLTLIPRYEKLGIILQDVVLADSSIHNTLFRVVCTTPQVLESLYTSRLFELREIEGLQLAITSALDIIYIMLSKISKDTTSSFPVLHQEVLSAALRPISLVAAVISLSSYSRYPPIQVGSIKLLAVLLVVADGAQPKFSASACFSLSDKQIADMRYSIKHILLENSNEDLVVKTVNLLTCASRYQPAFLVAILPAKECMIPPTNDAPPGLEKSNAVDSILHLVETSADLMKSNPRMLFYVLDLLKALWQGAGHYRYILDFLKGSGNFWKHLCNCVSEYPKLDSPPLESLTEIDAQMWAFRNQCQSATLEILASDMFLEKKFVFSDSLLKGALESKERTESIIPSGKANSGTNGDSMSILSSWCEKSILGSLIRMYTCSPYDNNIYFRAKVAASALTLHVMKRLAIGDAGSLSPLSIEKIHGICEKLNCQPAFSELMVHYAGMGYSDGKQLKTLILSDLYYHIQGELEGRKISPGPFKELSRCIIESNILEAYRYKADYDNPKDWCLFDNARVQADLGLDKWDHSDWKTSKPIAEGMLDCMRHANSMELITSSRFSALKALISLLTIYADNSTGNTSEGKIPDELVFSCIDHICKRVRTEVESLAPALPLDASEDAFNFLTAQAELLLYLLRSVQNSLTLSTGALILETVCFVLKLLLDFRSSVSRVNTVIKLLLGLQLFILEISCKTSNLSKGLNDTESAEFAKVSNLSMGLLPVLCSCIMNTELWYLALTTVDFILTSILIPQTWFPIIRDHLPFQHLTIKLQDKSCLSSTVPGILKLFLTLSYVRDCAELLLNAGLFSSLKLLLENNLPSDDGTDKPQNIWGLGMAVVAVVVQTLGDSTSCINVVEEVIRYFFSEKCHTISYFLNSPDFTEFHHDKKRPRAQKTQISLSDLGETEHTLMLMCVLARHWNSWLKLAKENDSQLGEKCIHLLAFISRSNQYLGDLAGKTAPSFCSPVLKDEYESCKKPSFMNSRNGWFALAALSCQPRTKMGDNNTNRPCPTLFSDSVAMEIYVIAFLLLRFLCLQVDGTSKRSEELGFVDLAHFPELPVPEILHGLQDQASRIISSLCEANKSTPIQSSAQSACLLMLQIMEMSLYLEFCVLQICGIRPVLGRVEDFSKEIKLLFRAAEGHAFLKASMKSIKQIISLLYPGLLESEGFL